MLSLSPWSMLQQVPAPLLVLSANGRLLACSLQACDLLPHMEDLVGEWLGDALLDSKLFEQRLREARGFGQAIPVRLVFRGRKDPVHIYCSLQWIAPEAAMPECFIAVVRPHMEVVRRFLALNEHLSRLDAEVMRREKAESALRDREAWLRVVLNSIADGVLTADTEEKVSWMNPAAELMCGWTLAEAHGVPARAVMELIDERTRRAVPHPVGTALQERCATGMLEDSVLLSRSGREIAVENSAAPIFDDRGRLVGAVIVFHDVTERRRLSREIAERAVRDALTGLCNRCEFETRLEETVASARGGEVHSLMYLDLDHFKIVNDTCGHPVGDQLLRELAEVFRQSVRSSDLVARLGGDEFGILLPHCNAEAALRTANELLKRVESFRFQHEMGRFRVGVSIGLVQIDGACANSETLMQSADTACYAAKEAGGQRVLVWQDKGQTAELRGRMVWAQRLSDAIEGDAFDLHLQRMEPLGDAPLPAHVEVLLRLRNADAGVVYPGEFLPAAERFRLAPSIDRWVLEQVIQRLSADPLAHVRVSVNFSGQSLSDRAFRDEALGLLRAAGPSISSRLCVEITETEAVRNYADAADFMGRLRDQGASVALDDYGAGASSFAYLRRLPIDWLKIDGQFVKDLPNQRLNFIAMRAFVDAAHSVGARCVAEHVETEQELEALRLLGLDLAQGFLLHRPVDWATVWATLPRHPLPQPAVTTLKH